MARKVAIPCDDCGRRFGGQDTWDRHRVIAGDRYRCRSDAELRTKGFWLARDGVWHRGPIPGQLEAFGPGETGRTQLSRISDPDTSRVAAKVLRSSSVKARLLEIYRLDPAGLTDEEAASRVGLELYGVTKRVSDLVREGRLEPTGVRKGRSGLDRRVCRVAEQVSA